MSDKVKLILISLSVVAIVFTYPFMYFNSQDIVTVEVLDKERIGIDSDTYKFLVYTPDEVFENTDTLWFLKYRSSDLQRDLAVGETFTVKVVGWRIPFLSKHRNIIRIEPEK